MQINKKFLIFIIISFAILAVSISAGDNDNTANNPKNLQIGKVKATQVQSYQTLTTKGETRTIHSVTEPSEPEVPFTSSRQGGEDIATATPIPGMPFIDSGTTTGYNDDYQESCPAQATNNPDVVYSYTPSINELVDISLCQSSFGTNLWVYQTTADTLVACNRFNTDCGANPRSKLVEVPMDSGITYYIVIDGDYIVTPAHGDYVIECSAVPAPEPVDSVRQHPAFGDAGNGYIILGYEYNNGVDSMLFWQGSSDDGVTWPAAGSFTSPGLPTFAGVDYWMDDTSFCGTQVGPKAESNGARTYLTKLWNAADVNSWSQSSWDWSSYGWHDMRMADIACTPDVAFTQQPGYRFGIITMVHSSTYDAGSGPIGNDAPFIFYEIDSTTVGWGTISWYNDLNGCNSTMNDIDDITKYAFAVYDRWNPDNNQWELFIRKDWFTDMDVQDSASGFTYALDPGNHIQHPAVAAYNGHVLIVAEVYNDTLPNDHDIVVWYDPDSSSSIATLATSVVVATTDDERYPRISHISGNNYVVSYIANNQLYLTVTNDGGITWDTSYVISGTDYVVNEYRSADIADGGQKVVWEYQPGLPTDSSIFLHFAETNVIQDSDSDGIPDPDDNCPNIANPGQEDADGDGIGDVCDDCTDTDGDGYGNPGYAANTCPVDNCPDNYNPGQEDTNNDGIGDACCCVDIRGNVDGIDGPAGPIDVNDLTYLVDYLFGSPTGPQPPCPDEGNVDGIDGPAGPIDVNDLTYLVDYLFGSPTGPQPPACP